MQLKQFYNELLKLVAEKNATCGDLPDSSLAPGDFNLILGR